MLKKFFRNYGFSIITTVVLAAVFALGFIFGKYAKSAPSLEAIEREQYKQEQAEKVVEDADENIVEVEPVTSEATPAEKYTEMRVTATAYCPCAKCCGKSDGITATGKKATAGRTIAVDPSVIPYGTEVVINGHTYIAEDCGGLVKGKRIDIFFDSHEDALQFGVQKMTVLVKE